MTNESNHIIQTDEMVACFVNTEQPPIRKKHICFNVKVEGYDCVLSRIDKYYYPHPSAPDTATICVVRETFVKSMRTTNPLAAGLMMVFHAQNNMKNLYSIEHHIEE